MKAIVINGGVKTGLAILSVMFLTFLVLSQVLGSFASGTTYYVSPTGSDTDPGTESQPWKTIQKAADTLSAGDTVYIKAGTYQERVVPQNSGSAGIYITYSAYSGDTVTIDGETVEKVQICIFANFKDSQIK